MLRWGVVDDSARKGYDEKGNWNAGTRLMFNNDTQCVELHQGKEKKPKQTIETTFGISKGGGWGLFKSYCYIYVDWREEKIVWYDYYSGSWAAVSMPVEWANNRHTIKLHQTAELKHKGDQIKLY